MRIWYFSDLHLEQTAERVSPHIPDAAVCVVAGDILEGGVSPSIEWLGTHISPHIPVVFVAGNHEHYSATLSHGLRQGSAAALRYSDLHFLENDAIMIGDVYFLGATLWTDFDLFGKERRMECMSRSKGAIPDFHRIRYLQSSHGSLSPLDTREMHMQSRAYLEGRLLELNGKRKVVVTHHAPSRGSILPQYKDNPTSSAFVSNMDDLILRTQPDLWIHGHVHSQFGFAVGGTRVLCNSAGFKTEPSAATFDPAKVVEI